MKKKMPIGERIRLEVVNQNLSKAEFARRINTSTSNAIDIFKRKSMDTDQLIKISEVLNHDFFKYFSADIKPEKKDNRNMIRISVDLEFDRDELAKQIKQSLNKKD